MNEALEQINYLQSELNQQNQVVKEIASAHKTDQK
jgi:hypothetical protein